MTATTFGVVAGVGSGPGLGSTLVSTGVGVLLALAIFALYYRYVLRRSAAD